MEPKFHAFVVEPQQDLVALTFTGERAASCPLSPKREALVLQPPGSSSHTTSWRRREDS